MPLCPTGQAPKQHPPRTSPLVGKALGEAAPRKLFANASTNGTRMQNVVVRFGRGGEAAFEQTFKNGPLLL